MKHGHLAIFSGVPGSLHFLHSVSRIHRHGAMDVPEHFLPPGRHLLDAAGCPAVDGPGGDVLAQSGDGARGAGADGSCWGMHII